MIITNNSILKCNASSSESSWSKAIFSPVKSLVLTYFPYLGSQANAEKKPSTLNEKRIQTLQKGLKDLDWKKRAMIGAFAILGVGIIGYTTWQLYKHIMPEPIKETLIEESKNQQENISGETSASIKLLLFCLPIFFFCYASFSRKTEEEILTNSNPKQNKVRSNNSIGTDLKIESEEKEKDAIQSENSFETEENQKMSFELMKLPKDILINEIPEYLNLPDFLNLKKVNKFFNKELKIHDGKIVALTVFKLLYDLSNTKYYPVVQTLLGFNWLDIKDFGDIYWTLRNQLQEFANRFFITLDLLIEQNCEKKDGRSRKIYPGVRDPSTVDQIEKLKKIEDCSTIEEAIEYCFTDLEERYTTIEDDSIPRLVIIFLLLPPFNEFASQSKKWLCLKKEGLKDFPTVLKLIEKYSSKFSKKEDRELFKLLLLFNSLKLQDDNHPIKKECFEFINQNEDTLRKALRPNLDIKDFSILLQ